MRAAKRVFLAQRQAPHDVDSSHPPPYLLASAAAHGASRREIYRWLAHDLSEEKIKERLSHRGRHRKFSEEMDNLMIGYVIDRRLEFLSVSRDIVKSFAVDYLGVNPRPQYISEILAKSGLTLQTSKARNSRLTSEAVVNDAIATIIKIRELGFPPERIVVFDETGLWSNVVQPHTYHFKNWCAGLETLWVIILVTP